MRILWLAMVESSAQLIYIHTPCWSCISQWSWFMVTLNKTTSCMLNSSLCASFSELVTYLLSYQDFLSFTMRSASFPTLDSTLTGPSIFYGYSMVKLTLSLLPTQSLTPLRCITKLRHCLWQKIFLVILGF